MHFMNLFWLNTSFKMSEYNRVNVNLSDSQLNQLKLATKIEKGVALRLLSNISHENDETNYLHKSLLTNRQVASFGKVFANSLSTNIKL